MKERVTHRINLAMIGVAVAAGVLTMPFTPERVPVHWDLSGTADR